MTNPDSESVQAHQHSAEKGLPSRVVRHLRRRKFIRAYTVLRDVADRHKAAGHDTEFIAVNESRVLLMCHGCPDFPSTARPVPTRVTSPGGGA